MFSSCPLRRTQGSPSSREPEQGCRPLLRIPAANNCVCIPPSFPNGVFLRKKTPRHKSIKSFVVEATGGEEGDETDMARIRVTPRNVEGGARLKQREMVLDDAIVEDTPPSKIAKNSLKCLKAQENHDVEGSSKTRARFGSVPRGFKAKHP
ncbi:hypothetical protein RHGRI_029584 [Rhododendron griersonianum]|uniref:Uncharacterized protein n=1 Tax=Rhododendron griersonianum TaxID=479676 RepID=A0AAV6IK17_9ERIC|nr:hypothetical protein RHGRI_029584 [Rhododendron griersonianum]